MKGKYLIIALIINLLNINTANSQDKFSVFIDTTDNALDLSKYLYDLNGFLPIPTLITEPAVGYGGALAAVFFIPKEKKDRDVNKFQMPDIIGAAGGYTENGTWFGGAGYMGFWNKDRIRYRGVIGYVNANLKFYGKDGGILENKPLKFSLSGTLLLQQMVFRLGESNFLLGGKYQLFSSTTKFLEDSEYLPTDGISKKLTSSGIGLIAEYENLNNILSPTSGIRSNITYDQQLQFIGSDFNAGRISFFTHYYLPIKDKWVSGFRVESQLGFGDNPFYALPFISLRGVPAMRYQGDLIALLETEQQYMFSKRWSAIAFAGIGSTFNIEDEIAKGSNAWNLGVGFRYLIAKALGLRMGVDVAKGPEDWGVYIVAGTSWLR